MNFLPAPQHGTDRHEALVWRAVKAALAKEPGLAALRYPIWSDKHRTHYEPDVLLLHPRWGLVVLEVKGFLVGDLAKVSGQVWTLQGRVGRAKELDPVAQAKAQMFAWKQHFAERGLNLWGTAVVVLPGVTRAQWAQAGFDRDPGQPFLLFQEDLAPKALPKALEALCGGGHRQPPPEAFAQALRGLELPNQGPRNSPWRWSLALTLGLFALGCLGFSAWWWHGPGSLFK